MTPCILTEIYKHFGITYCLHLHGGSRRLYSKGWINTEEGGSVSSKFTGLSSKVQDIIPQE
jgi:hypothetical protein